MAHKPKWFRDDAIFVSYAPTIGINKDGNILYKVDENSGLRTDEINNIAEEDIEELLAGNTTDTSTWVSSSSLDNPFIGVAVYQDTRSENQLEELLDKDEFSGFTIKTLGDLIGVGDIKARAGHGSPSADVRKGDIPYIKVSDIRAGQLNINPTNMVSKVIAERFWKGKESGLRPYDLISPIRTSKNIGDFALLMPGQENVVLTKEMLVLHAEEQADFDNFYLLWALSLKAVRNQWDRIIFMQTNREDVGLRYREIKLPVPPSKSVADKVSEPTRSYYLGVESLRKQYIDYLQKEGMHHIFMSTANLESEINPDNSEV